MPPAPIYFRFRRFPEKILDRKSLKVDILAIFQDGGTIPNMFFDNSKHYLIFFLKKKSVYLTLIRSPLWSLVKSEKNMLGPIFDFLNLPSLFSLAGRDICAMETCLALGETHSPCGEAPCSGRDTCALWRGSMPV